MQTLVKFLTIIFLLFVMTSLDAQSELVYKDRVYLKYGSIFMGSVKDYIPGDKLILILENGKELTFGDEQIKKVIMHNSTKDKNYQIIPLKENKFFHEVQFSFLTNVNGTGYTLGYSIMYQKNQLIAFGAGVGLDNYYAAPGREIMPLFANAKINLTSSNNAPYLGMKLGYGFAFERDAQNITEAQGGLMTNPYFGIRIGSRGTIVNLFTGLKFQKVDYVINNAWDTRREDILHRRLEIGISVMF